MSGGGAAGTEPKGVGPDGRSADGGTADGGSSSGLPEIYWEDLPVGTVIELGTREVSKEEILEFAGRYDPQPFHTDENAAKDSIFGGLVASGWHTCAMMMRLVCDGLLHRAASLGSPGVDEVRWMAPVRPGDVLTGRIEVLESRPSRSKPDRGLIKSRWDVRNQDDVVVMTLVGIAFYRRRHPG